MKTKAAILWEIGQEWSVEEIELDPPKAGRGAGEAGRLRHVPLRRAPRHRRPARSRCRSSAGTRVPASSRRSGPGVSWLQPGDHVVFGFIPSCGRCPSCSTGHQNLCDLGMYLGGGLQIADQTVAPPRAGQGSPPHVPARHVQPPHGRQRGELHQDRARRPARQGLPPRLRRGHRLGLGRVRGRRPARRHRRRRRRRRHRRQRHPGRPPRRGQAHRRHRPRRAEAGEGDGVRRHPHRRVARGGPPAPPGDHLGHDGQQGHHDHGRRQRRADGPGAGPDLQARPGRGHQHPPRAGDRAPR